MINKTSIIRKVVHNDPWKIEELWWSHERRVACFKKADAIHLLLSKFTESLPDNLHHKIFIIPNGAEIPAEVNLNNREKVILAVGRLEQQKRFDRLIDAVGKVQDSLRKNGNSVTIAGEGSLRFELQKQIDALGVQDLITLLGATPNIEEFYERSDFFVIPSEFEGFGMALVEAMSYGLPAIGFRDCNGPNEIIIEEKSGALVDSTDELARKIDEWLLLDLMDFRKYAILESEKFTIGKFYRNWERNLKSFLETC